MADCNWTGEYHPNCGINTGVTYYSDAPFYTGCCPRSIDGTDTTEEEFNQAIIDRNALLVLISTGVPSQVYSWRGEIVYWENGTAEPADPPILGADETMHLAGGPSPASYAIRGGDMIHQSEEQVLDWFKSTMNCEANNNTSTYNMNRVTHTNPSYKYYDYHPQAVVDLIVYGYCNTIECPPNTHLEDGYCVPDEDWEWCDDSHTSVCPHCYTLGCLEATDGSANPDCYDVGDTFEVCMEWKPYDPDCQPTSEMDYFDISIIYEGSLANSISGPDTVRIDIQDNSTGCITLTVNSSIQEGGTLSIIPTSVPLCDPNESAVVLELCTVNTTVTIPETDPGSNGIINCDNGGNGGNGGGGTGPNGEVYGPEDCCSYMPKDYLVWKEGVGLAETIPPYMKSFFINNE